MKVPISDYAVINLDAPTLAAYEVLVGKAVRWAVWCKHCQAWHHHGPAEGHRESHCSGSESPYFLSGYNLAFAGKCRHKKKSN